MERRAVLASPATSPALAGAATSEIQSFVDTDDGQHLFVRDAGEGRPVVFIHGWTLSSEIWRGQFDWLSRHGTRAVAYDRRGHGQSSKPMAGYSYDELAADLAAVLDRLDLADVVLVAHSMGAGEAVRYLARQGNRRISHLMLLAPTTPYAFKTEDNPQGIDRQMYDMVVGALRSDRLAYLKAGMPPFLGANTDPKLADWTMTIALQASLEAEIQCLRAFSETDFRSDLRAITTPTLIVYGTAESPTMPVNARRTHDAIAESRLEIYEGAPHALFLTDMERFNRDLLQFSRS